MENIKKPKEQIKSLENEGGIIIEGQEKKQLIVESPIGKIYLVASDCGLEGLHWEDQGLPLETFNHSTSISRTLKKAEEELIKYFQGNLTKFEVPLNPKGTQFQEKVWQALLDIPYGSVITYTELARKIEQPSAVRAVASANAANQLCIIIPCHRVITSSGSLGGYSGGEERKTSLLNIEGGQLGNIMIRVDKELGSNVVNVFVSAEGEELVAATVIVQGVGKKISKVTLETFPIPDPLLDEAWIKALEKGQRIHKALEKILPGKSYRDFLAREISDI